MHIVETILISLHVLTSLAYIAASLVLVFIFHPIWARYHSYSLFANFRLEFTQLILKSLNTVIAIALVTGVGLIGIYQRNVLAGTYGLLFTAKMLLLILSFFLAQPYFKPYDTAENLNSLEKTKSVFNSRSVFILITNILLVFVSVYHKQTAF